MGQIPHIGSRVVRYDHGRIMDQFRKCISGWQNHPTYVPSLDPKEAKGLRPYEGRLNYMVALADQVVHFPTRLWVGDKSMLFNGILTALSNHAVELFNKVIFTAQRKDYYELRFMDLSMTLTAYLHIAAKGVINRLTPWAFSNSLYSMAHSQRAMSQFSCLSRIAAKRIEKTCNAVIKDLNEHRKTRTANVIIDLCWDRIRGGAN